jgi:hypothetical protein
VLNWFLTVEAWVKSARILETWSLSFATCPNNSSPELGGILVGIMSDDNLQQDENASQTGEEMSTADAVSLFTTSLNSALAKQKQDILSELQHF